MVEVLFFYFIYCTLSNVDVLLCLDLDVFFIFKVSTCMYEQFLLWYTLTDTHTDVFSEVDMELHERVNRLDTGHTQGKLDPLLGRAL